MASILSRPQCVNHNGEFLIFELKQKTIEFFSAIEYIIIHYEQLYTSKKCISLK